MKTWRYSPEYVFVAFDDYGTLLGVFRTKAKAKKFFAGIKEWKGIPIRSHNIIRRTVR